MELFKLFGKIAIDNTEANKDIDETTEKASDSSGSMVESFKKIGGAVASYLAVDKIVGFGKACIEEAASVQAQTAQFEAAFGDLGEAAQEAFATVGSETGILSTRLQTEGTKAFSMFKGAGMDAEAALEETETFMRLAADAAAYYDISLEEASERVLGFAKGNFENGDAIGVFTNEAQRNAIAMEQYGQKYADCTEAQKQMMALDMISNTYEMSGALGQASREADGYENVTGNLKESWRQFQAVLGAPILASVIPIIKNLTSGIADFTEKTKAAIQWMQEHQTLMTVIAIAVGTLVAAITAYNISLHAAAIATAVATAATTAFGAASKFATSHITWIVLAIGALIAIGVVLYKNWDTIKAKAIEIWGAISEWFSSVWEGIKATISSFSDWLSNKVNSVITAVSGFFTGLWSNVVSVFEAIKNAITVAIMFIAALFQAAFQIITLPFMFIWENCKQYVFAAWEWIKSIVSTAINAVSGVIQTVMGAISAFFSTVWGTVTSIFQTSLNAIKSVVSTVFNAIKSVVTTVWNAIKSKISSVLNAIKSVVTTVWNGIKSAISTALNAIKSTVSSIFNSVKSTASSVWNGIKSAISTAVNNIKSTVTSVFEAVKTKIETPINNAKETVKGALDAIKGFFDGLNLEFPDIKLPHFSLKGSFSLAPPSVPTLSIDWYAKAMNNPMLLNDPTIFGYNPESGQYLGAGEAGAEVVSGANPLMRMIGDAVATQNGGIVYYLQRIMQILAEFFPQVLEAVDFDISIDGAAVARKTAPHMDKELAKIQKSKERGGSK